MHILLTDVVSCPRCGPEFGLIVLADRIKDRRVLTGHLGCPNCREEYRISEGIADLRWGGGGDVRTDGGAGGAHLLRGDDPERVYRLAALLGVTGPSGPIVVVTDDPEVVAGVQRHLPESGVVGLSRELPGGAAGAGVGWLLSRGEIAFRDRSLGGVALASGDPLPLIPEALRCLGRGARLVIDPAPEGAARRVVEEGGEVLLEQDGVAVAFDPRAR